MPALQVRDLPQSLYDELQQRAMREHRSMAQQTIVALEDHLRGGSRQAVPECLSPEWSDGDERARRERIERKRELLERIHERAASSNRSPGEVADVAQLVRDMRDERADCLLEVLRGETREGESR